MGSGYRPVKADERINHAIRLSEQLGMALREPFRLDAQHCGCCGVGGLSCFRRPRPRGG